MNAGETQETKQCRGKGWFTPAISIVAAAIMTVSVIVPPERLPATPVCGFRLLTGRLCPGCGMTHAVCAIGHLRFRDAWNYNPLSFLVYPVLILALIGAFLFRRKPQAEKRLAYYAGRLHLQWILPLLLFGFAIFRIWRGH